MNNDNNTWGTTPLCFMGNSNCKFYNPGHVEVVRLLLDRGAKLNVMCNVSEYAVNKNDN